MIFEIGERVLPVFVIRRSHRLVVEIDDPFILFGIDRRFPRQGQPHETARTLRLNTFLAREKRLTKKSLRLEVALVGGEKQPADGLPAVLVNARALEMHPRQIILSVRIAESRRRELKHLEGAMGVGPHLTVGYPFQIINSKRDKGARHNRAVAPVRVVLIVISNDLRKIIISLEIVTRSAVATGIYFGELPLRQRFASPGGIFQGLDRGSGIARTNTFEAGLQRCAGCRESLKRRLFGRRAIGSLEGVNPRSRQTDSQAKKNNTGQAARRRHRHLSHSTRPGASPCPLAGPATRA